VIRIANGQGFWGDWLEAPVRLVDQGRSIFWCSTTSRSHHVDPAEAEAGRPGARLRTRLPSLIGRLAKKLKDRNIKVVANAGGVNPSACAHAVLKAAPGLKVAVVHGTTSSTASMNFSRKVTRCAIWTPAIRSRPFAIASCPQRLYRRFPLAEALDTGADIVIADAPPTPRSPGAHGAQVRLEARRLEQAGGGHDRRTHIECGAQCSGGNCQVEWEKIRTWPMSGIRSSKPSPTVPSS